MEETISYKMENSESDSESNSEIIYNFGHPLYPAMSRLVYNTCMAKRKLFMNSLYEGGAEYDAYQHNDYYVLYNYAVDESIRVNNYLTIGKIICEPAKTDKYVHLLLTYNKYNKLNVLKNKTKLNNDIIFDIIIKYL